METTLQASYLIHSLKNKILVIILGRLQIIITKDSIRYFYVRVIIIMV